MRKAILISRWTNHGIEKVSEPIIFHQWGSDYEEFEAGPGNYTVAIIEHSDGRVETVAPAQIQFMVEEE